jgi:hypothetical protein
MGLLFLLERSLVHVVAYAALPGGNVLNPERGIYLSTSKSMTRPCWIEGRPERGQAQ